jgi:hypothetical protein
MSSSVLGAMIGAVLGAGIGWLNRPTYAFGIRPSLDDYSRNSQIATDLGVEMGIWVVILGVVGAVAGVLLSRTRK